LAIKPPVPSSSENQFIKTNVDKVVSASMSKYFGQPDTFINIVNRNPDSASAGGDQLYHAFMVTEDPEQLGQMKEAVGNIMSFPGGSQALQMAFGDDYKKVVGISVISDVFTNGDVQKAKSIFAESSGTLVQGSIDPDIKERMYENSYDLGTLGDEYIYTVNTLLNVNQGIVDKGMLDSLYDKFAEGRQERGDVKFNVSRFDTSANAYDPEVFNDQVIEMVTSMNGDVAPMEITNLRGNIMAYTDEFGMAAGVINTTPVLNIGNQLYAAMAVNDEKQVDFLTRSGDTFDSINTWVSSAVTTNWFNTGAQKEIDQEMMNQLGEIWSAASADKGKISEVILSVKAMYPEVISEEAIPDFETRKNVEARNLEIQGLIEQMATKFTGSSLESLIEAENPDPNLEIYGP